MRTLLMIALGLSGVGSFAEPALAEKAGVMHCARIHSTCRQSNPGHGDSCLDAFLTCSRNNSDLGYNDRGEPFKKQPPPKKEIVILPPDGRPQPSGGETDTPGNDRFSFEGLGSSKPTGKTVNGQTEMVTASGKVWLWNGKTNTVFISKGNRSETFTVRQGDPDVHMTAVVDGKRYNVASPAYSEAMAKKLAAKPPQPAPQPKPSVCAGWGCPKPEPKTSTIVQESGGAAPKPATSSIKLGGVGNWQPLNGAAKVAAPAATPAAATAAPVVPASIQRPGLRQLPAFRGLPDSQQYKFQNKPY
jgi:hypothetical protein